MNGALPFWLAADAPVAFGALKLDADALAALARRRLAGTLRGAARAPFYRDRLEAAGVDVADPVLDRDPDSILAALPPVTKQSLREAGTAALAGGRVGASWRSSRSSGSTGEPFEVFYDARAWAMLKYLVKLRARLECGMRLTDRVASLEAVSTSALPAEMPTSRQRMARLNVLRPAGEVAAALASFAPDVVTGLPSALLEAGGVLEADGTRLAIRGIFTGGELLQRTSRQSLERMYGTRVFDVYGTSETKEIAWECRLGGLHVNADVVHVEVLDETGRAVPLGREGDIVATVLVNHAMPLLRYRTGDRGTLISGRCSCGRATPLLGVVTGRETETLVFGGGLRVSPYALTCTLEQVKELTRYQVTQLNPALLRVRAIMERGTDPSVVENKIRSVLRTDVAGFLDVEVEFVDRLPTGARSKFRVVEPLR